MNDTVSIAGDAVSFTVTRTETISMSPALQEFIRATVSGSGRIPALKYVRAEYSLGLKEAKLIVDRLVDGPYTQRRY